MIIKHQIPVWPEDDATQYLKTYSSIVENFQQAFENKYSQHRVLLVDNTYLNAQQVCSAIQSHSADVVAVFSFVDPAYPWHYLWEILTRQFPGMPVRLIGNESPDINIPFFWLLTFSQMPRYLDSEVLPTEFDYVYLNYNNKPHVHRTQFLELLQQRDLLSLGFVSLAQDLTMENNLVQNLGDLALWRRHFLNIDSATVFRTGDNQLLLSEKEFKPIIGLRPFVINGSPRYYSELFKLGFDLFEDIFPVHTLSQELSTLEDTMQKNHNIIADLILQLSTENLHLLYKKLLPRLYKNRQWFLDQGQSLIDQWCYQPIDL